MASPREAEVLPEDEQVFLLEEAIHTLRTAEGILLNLQPRTLPTVVADTITLVNLRRSLTKVMTAVRGKTNA